ncbi:MAG: phosphatidylserine decarboxylase [Alphaproteobacteria bacterium]|jgi:phosphatidylserine decarboxylase|nr:phosphatidylserine decarboxylase [Alphaproteobacteria bacterium]
MLDIIFPPLHREGYRMLAIAVIITMLLILINKILGVIGFVLTVWVYYFFRDPERYPINDDSFLVSPADGVISLITNVRGPKELNMENKEFQRVSVFMNVFNCHVNRVPITGKIDEIFYKPGKFIDASLDKASEDNERNLIKYSNNSGKTFAIVQIAGLVARRIVCEVKEGQNLNQGDRIGIIRFGSRVDLYFDNDYKLLAKQGQTVVAGESLLAKI